MGPLPAARLCKSIKSDTHSSRYEPQVHGDFELSVRLFCLFALERVFTCCVYRSAKISLNSHCTTISSAGAGDILPSKRSYPFWKSTINRSSLIVITQMEQLSEKDVPLLFSDHLTRQFGHVFDQASAGGHLVKRVLKFTQKLRKITQTYTNELDALVSYEQQKVLAIKDNSECKLATLGTLSQFQAMAEGYKVFLERFDDSVLMPLVNFRQVSGIQLKSIMAQQKPKFQIVANARGELDSSKQSFEKLMKTAEVASTKRSRPRRPSTSKSNSKSDPIPNITRQRSRTALSQSNSGPRENNPPKSKGDNKWRFNTISRKIFNKGSPRAPAKPNRRRSLSVSGCPPSENRDLPVRASTDVGVSTLGQGLQRTSSSIFRRVSTESAQDNFTRKCRAACENYQTALDVVNDAEEIYYLREVPEFLKRLQSLEERRIVTVSNVYTDLSKISSHMCDNFKEVNSSTKELNVRTCIDSYVSQMVTRYGSSKNHRKRTYSLKIKPEDFLMFDSMRNGVAVCDEPKLCENDMEVSVSVLATVVTPLRGLNIHSIKKRANLTQIISNKDSRKVFMNFLKSIYCQENLDFFLAVNEYGSLKFDSNVEARAAAKIITDRFLGDNAVQQVNLSSSASELVISRIHNVNYVIDEGFFKDIRKDVFDLMFYDSFPKFLKSDAFRICMQILPHLGMRD
eukprot:988353_1